MPDIVIVFFALGLFAGLVKSDLKIPPSIYETLSILLMLILGLKGGMALHGRTDEIVVSELLLIAGLGLLIPFVVYPVLRRFVRLPQIDAVSLAAHYGSVSAGTFAVVYAMAEQGGLQLRPETTLYLVLLELPAIMIMLMFYRVLQRRATAPAVSMELSGSAAVMSGGNGFGATAGGHSPAGKGIISEALTSRGVMLLLGGVLIGWLYGPVGLEPLAPALFGGYTTLLALFLLEMGLCTAQICNPLPLKHWRLIVFAAVTPFILAWFGIVAGITLGLPEGSVLVLAGLTASASYIAAPAAIRAAMPEANIGLAMLAALGVTFPVNVLIGLPVYHYWIKFFV